ncbi:membrane protein [Youhaiella tibetensis]|uniref:DUF3817 domain-containing protein n=1 Tax=Paradevosia tibetensis TaxID=1447062 RepID=A0A5B9DTT0_9HYPH|nr:DUF3817 domain-containing protein [Youhaiella tibetensis]AKR57665.1 membrane protein [Devosia sp. H5989]QEE22586.1 DUF3817 domain-containing protein [Youhaiella tibetensis]GGF40815.1 membrane protein [Youhaiella tibetensis]
MIRFFRAIGLIEGITTLVLFLIAMPLKYLAGDPSWVPHAGAIHGLAFLAYIAALLVCLRGYGLSAWDWARTTLAAFIPFGTFLNDPFLKRKQRETEAA